MSILKNTYVILLLILLTVNLQASNVGFEKAYQEIENMLNNKQPLSFKRAVFLTENLYFDEKLSYVDFENQLSEIVTILKNTIKQKKLDTFKTGANYAVFNYMYERTEQNYNTIYEYDFENFLEANDEISHLVMNLLKTHKGNCHSMPYLYKILCNELDAEAHISLAPMHLFIKHRDENGEWWNLETTSGTFSRTSFLIETFQISDLAIESGFYMHPLTEKETIALCLNDLLGIYEKKGGNYYDDFVVKCANLGMQYFPKSYLTGRMADAVKYRLGKNMESIGLTSYEQINAYPELIDYYNYMLDLYDNLTNWGYKPVTSEWYDEQVRNMYQQKKENEQKQQQTNNK